MKRNQVALRKAKVRQRIEQLEEQKVRAGRDRHWYQSESFARTADRKSVV